MIPFSNYIHIHLVGIKGVAMTSIAQIFQDLGKVVTGSDVPEDFVTAEILKKFEFEILSGFDTSHITKDLDLVVYTGAHNGKNNVEVMKAVEFGIPVMSHAEALGMLMEGKRGISVCGTGGKSTTSAMIAWILEYAGKKPSYAIGVGNVPNLGRTGRYRIESAELRVENEEKISTLNSQLSTESWFVAEADEYAVDPTSDHRPRFIYQHPEIIVLTSLHYDHPDIYPDFESMQKTFQDFFATLPPQGILISDDTVPEDFVPFDLLLPGKHNQKNAYFAMLATKQCGVEETTARKALSVFTSTMRRFEFKGKIGEVEMYDDYAHTPDEIRSTIQAIREWRPEKRVVVAFQPHTYSRTKALFDGFVQELSQADEVILLDIFASAREAADTTVSTDLLAQKLSTLHSQLSTYAELAKKLPEILKSGDIFITMGAGDIYKVYEMLEMSS